MEINLLDSSFNFKLDPFEADSIQSKLIFLLFQSIFVNELTTKKLEDRARGFRVKNWNQNRTRSL